MKCEYTNEIVINTKRDADGFSDYDEELSFDSFYDWYSEWGIIRSAIWVKGSYSKKMRYEAVDHFILNPCSDYTLTINFQNNQIHDDS